VCWSIYCSTSEELTLLNSAILPTALALTLDMPLADLEQGNDTLEFVAVNMPQGYSPMCQ
jgi:hypothetical protein